MLRGCDSQLLLGHTLLMELLLPSAYTTCAGHLLLHDTANSA